MQSTLSFLIDQWVEKRFLPLTEVRGLVRLFVFVRWSSAGERERERKGLELGSKTNIEDARIKLDKEILSIEKNIYLDTWLLIFLAAILQ